MATEAVIYLAEKRGCTQSLTYRSFHCFNMAVHKNKSAFHDLVALNDETLMPAAHVVHSLLTDHMIVLLPVIGKLEYKLDDEVSAADAGECVLLYGKKGSSLSLTNPYKEEAINFICAWLDHHKSGEQYILPSGFDLDKTKDTLTTLFTTEHVKCQIGKFSGRKNVELTLRNAARGAFAFVLEGAFEVEDRVLHQKDGLAISTASKISFEALSNDAILLMIELRYKLR
jgi:hypothetical protein